MNWWIRASCYKRSGELDVAAGDRTTVEVVKRALVLRDFTPTIDHLYGGPVTRGEI